MILQTLGSLFILVLEAATPVAVLTAEVGATYIARYAVVVRGDVEA